MLAYTPTMRRDHGLTVDQFTAIRRTGRALRSELRDDFTGEIDATILAEGIAHQLARHDWLDDPAHPVWDVAADLAEQ
jgi:hypothetical protein